MSGSPIADVRFEIVDPGAPEAVAALITYFEELAATFVDGFEAGDTLTADAPAMRAPNGAFLIARQAGRVVACGAVLLHDEHTGEIKRMWVDETTRGLGLGRRTLHELEHVARSLGYRRVVLDTNATLTSAIAMYERAGYTSIERYNDNPYAHHWFEKALDERSM